jgi:archaemetzincin
LLPIAGVRGEALENLARDLAGAGFHVVTLQQRAAPAGAYDRHRRQYRADVLLDLARREPADRVLAVTDLDLYSGDLNFVFGLAESPGKAALISLHRLRVGADERLVRQRALKEAVHELGHAAGLKHCTRRSCVMYFSNSLEDTDRKGSELCRGCTGQLAVD